MLHKGGSIARASEKRRQQLSEGLPTRQSEGEGAYTCSDEEHCVS